MDNERKDNYDLQKEIVDKNQRNVEELYKQVSDQCIRLNNYLDQFNNCFEVGHPDVPNLSIYFLNKINDISKLFKSCGLNVYGDIVEVRKREDGTSVWDYDDSHMGYYAIQHISELMYDCLHSWEKLTTALEHILELEADRLQKITKKYSKNSIRTKLRILFRRPLNVRLTLDELELNIYNEALKEYSDSCERIYNYDFKEDLVNLAVESVIRHWRYGYGSFELSDEDIERRAKTFEEKFKVFGVDNVAPEIERILKDEVRKGFKPSDSNPRFIPPVYSDESKLNIFDSSSLPEYSNDIERLNKNENAVLEQFDKISDMDYQDLTEEDIDSLISELDKTMQEMKDCYNEIISGTEDDEKKKGI